jgi:hypothetical protein
VKFVLGRENSGRRCCNCHAVVVAATEQDSQ